VRDQPGEDQFLLEALEDFRIGRHVRANDFQRNLALQLAVMRLVHRPHSALSQQTHDFVAPAQNRPWIQLCHRGWRNNHVSSGHGPALNAGGQRQVT